jgi:D-lactate dehydrogenase
MKIICFSTHQFEKKYLDRWAVDLNLEVSFLETSLSSETAALTKGFNCVSCWASDNLGTEVLEILKNNGVEMISLRSAGFSHLDLVKAKELGIIVARVPAYSPEAIAEHTLGLFMCLNRKYLKAFQRVRDFNFTLDGLEGMTVHGKTVGIIGLGKIGEAFARIMHGMGCSLYFCDPVKNEKLEKELNAEYVSLEKLLSSSDIISLHCPLNDKTFHLINSKTIELIKPTAFLLNTGRGALIDTKVLIDKLKRKELKGVGLDVYEHEEGVFFEDHSESGISDESLLRLMSFSNVLITSHQAFFTKEALENIAKISLENIKNYLEGNDLKNENFLSL